MSAPQLRPYQLEAIESVAAAVTRARHNRALVKMPTGTGKTVMFAEMLRAYEGRFEWLRATGRNGLKGARMLVIAHREELLDQAADKISKANPGLMVSIEQGDRRANRYSDVVVASIQTLQAMKFRRLKRLQQWHAFPLVVVDEAHHAAAASYRTALVHLGFLPPADLSEKAETEAADFEDVAEMEEALRGWDLQAPRDRLLVGVTATPNRSDAIGLGCVFQSLAFNYGLKDAIADGWLVPITAWVIETDTSLEAVRTSRGDFNQKELAEAVNNRKRNLLAVSGWHEHAKGLPTIAFTVDVAHAHELAEEFCRAGVRARALSGETPKEERRAMLRAFSAGQIEVLTNCMVLTEGTDLPLTRCILHAKPTKSATLYEQMTGRGLRPHPGKPDCIVIDLVDVARRHSLQASPVLYGLPPGLLAKGKKLAELEAEISAFQEANPGFDLEAALASGRLSLEALQARAAAFNVWSVPALGAVSEVVSLNWIRAAADVYRLQYPWQDGTETLTVSKDILGHFDIAASLRPHGRPGEAPGPIRQRTLASQLPSAVEALRAAEAWIQEERRQVTRLKDREAPWRQRTASEKQLALLRRLGVPHDPRKITMGAASDLIDVAQQRRGR
jgi:superfamily II DNA or RNA helicase